MVQTTIEKPEKQVSAKAPQTTRAALRKMDKEALAKLGYEQKDAIRIKVQVQFDFWQYQEIIRKAKAQHLPIAAYCRRASLMQKMPRE